MQTRKDVYGFREWNFEYLVCPKDDINIGLNICIKESLVYKSAFIKYLVCLLLMFEWENVLKWILLKCFEMSFIENVLNLFLYVK